MPQNSAYYAQIILHKSNINLQNFNIYFLFLYLTYKIMSISSLSSLAYHQQSLYYLPMYRCINTLNSFCSICNFGQYIFDNTIITNTPKSCEIGILYIFCLLCRQLYLLCQHYAECFCHPIMLKVMRNK